MMYRWPCTLTTLTAACCMSISVALAESRVALVIGNSAYRTVSALPNPANDAKAMVELLRSAGFDVVSAPDLAQLEMRQVIADFASEAGKRGPDTVVLVFYAGHGLQIDGENYLVPIDVQLTKESDVPLQAVRLSDLMNVLGELPSKTVIVMLDACRNNPFAEIKKTAGRGLAIVDAPAGSIVSYSTSPGAEAEDGTGADSPYTTALVSVAREPGLPIEQAFKRVRLSVHEATSGRQTPWESSSLSTDFFFFRSGTRPPPAPPKQPVAQTVDTWRRQIQGKPVREAYDIVIGADAVEAYEAFIAIHGAPPFGPRVRGLLERRREMVAWYTAVTINTLASFQAFLASYPNSDLVQTAKRMMERTRTRSLLANANPLVPANFTPGATCQCSPAPQQQQQNQRRTNISPPEPPPGPRRVDTGPPPDIPIIRGGLPPDITVIRRGPPDIPIIRRGPPDIPVIRRGQPPAKPPLTGPPPGPGDGHPPTLKPAINTGIAIGIGVGGVGRGPAGPPMRSPIGTTGPLRGPPMHGPN